MIVNTSNNSEATIWMDLFKNWFNLPTEFCTCSSGASWVPAVLEKPIKYIWGKIDELNLFWKSWQCHLHFSSLMFLFLLCWVEGIKTYSAETQRLCFHITVLVDRIRHSILIFLLISKLTWLVKVLLSLQWYFLSQTVIFPCNHLSATTDWCSHCHFWGDNGGMFPSNTLRQFYT